MDLKKKQWKRILDVLNPEIFKDVKVLVVGCGSGGSGVIDHLAKNGIRSFILVDNDILEIENIIRHICGWKDLGKIKVDAMKEHILNINPEAKVETYNVDITQNLSLIKRLVNNSDVVVGATDTNEVNFLINQICIENKTPVVFGKVYKKGIGGEVFRYSPESGGCLACLERVMKSNEIKSNNLDDDFNDEDWQEIYGSSYSEIKKSPGLSIDIGFITLLHARLILDTLLQGKDSLLPPINANYIIWANRPVHPFKSHFSREWFFVHPQNECLVCQGFGG